ncbi:hypothetical protein HK100_006859 [Physocladia obscura]|uniref:Uncharacterized protein n=1 Tax=Physocladia obscura TaxID=109957 RepID=A0AAD5XKM7_9FUNG|nr:hypothetical protein HK100_006859 [Physocladia obscura]
MIANSFSPGSSVRLSKQIIQMPPMEPIPIPSATSAASAADKTSFSTNINAKGISGIIAANDALPMPASRSQRSISTTSSRQTSSATLPPSNPQPQQYQLQETTLRVSVKQRNGSIATITTVPAKVTRGFFSPPAPAASSLPIQIGANLNNGRVVFPYTAYSAPVSGNEAIPLSTFFGVGEGQLLKERLKREQELREEQFYQQHLFMEKQFRDQQQHDTRNNQSLTNNGESYGIYDSKATVILQSVPEKVDERTVESNAGTEKKASFAIGVAEDDDESESSSPYGTVEQSNDGGFRAASNTMKHDSNQSITQNFVSQSDLPIAISSPVLTRRTFPSAPYLPLKTMESVTRSPTPSTMKLLLNPNPNSSSAADIPDLSSKAQYKPDPSVGVRHGNPQQTQAASAIPITKPSVQKPGVSDVCAVAVAPGAAVPEVQAPLHATPTATATSEADVQAAAAAARARGQNLPKNVPEFYRRLQDLRAHNIQHLSALRNQIDVLRTGSDDVVEYYEREMSAVVEKLRREEGYLVDFGRREMGIDAFHTYVILFFLFGVEVKTLSLMLSSLPTFEPDRTPKQSHYHEYPHTQDHIRRTKSNAHISNHTAAVAAAALARQGSIGAQQRIAEAVDQRVVAVAQMNIPRNRSTAQVVEMLNIAQEQQLRQQRLEQKYQQHYNQQQHQLNLSHLQQPLQQQVKQQQQQQYQYERQQQINMDSAGSPLTKQGVSVISDITPGPAIFSTVPAFLPLNTDMEEDYDDLEEHDVELVPVAVPSESTTAFGATSNDRDWIESRHQSNEVAEEEGTGLTTSI